MHDAILQLAHQAHALTEAGALAAPNALERKQLLLADLSLHLVQAALRTPQPQPEEVKRYLFGILTLADGFLDDIDLKALANVVSPPPVPAAAL